MTSFNFTNPAEQDIARLNRELDQLTADYKAAIEQQETPVGKQTGIERVADIMNRAGQLAKDKLGVGANAQALERYTQLVIDETLAASREKQLATLNQRARDLQREVAQAAEAAKIARYNVNDRMNKQMNELKNAGVNPDWLNSVREQVTAHFAADLVQQVKAKIGA